MDAERAGNLGSAGDTCCLRSASNRWDSSGVTIWALEVPTRDGWRARFAENGSLDQQVASLRAVRDELSRTRSPAELIDVRFADRPYFR